MNQIVESAPEILENISHDSREVRGNLAATSQIMNDLACLRILLDPNNIWVGIEKNSDFRLELIEMLFGPFNFYPDEG
jgi:hypothetical protein